MVILMENYKLLNLNMNEKEIILKVFDLLYEAQVIGLININI